MLDLLVQSYLWEAFSDKVFTGEFSKNLNKLQDRSTSAIPPFTHVPQLNFYFIPIQF